MIIIIKDSKLSVNHCFNLFVGKVSVIQSSRKHKAQQSKHDRRNRVSFCCPLNPFEFLNDQAKTKAIHDNYDSMNAEW